MVLIHSNTKVNRLRISAISCLALVLCLSANRDLTAQSIEDHWHQWRGPEANGVSRTANPPIEWSEDKNIQWKVAVDGQGTSTPIIWGDKLFLLTAIDTGKEDPSIPKPEDQPKTNFFNIKRPNTSFEFVVLCLNRTTGQEMWRRKVNELIPHEGHHNDNDYASSSPMTDGEHLYCWFGLAGLYCFDLDGNQIWKRDLGQVQMGSSLGEGCSPVVHDGKLVIVRDHSQQSTIETLDATTGETLWKRDRDEPNNWATPRIVEHAGRTQVITSGTNLVRSYDLDTGEIIWQCGGLSSNAIPCPVTDSENVYCMSGYKGYAALALPLSAQGDITDSDKVIWSKNEGTPYTPSPLLYDGMLYFNQSNQAIWSSHDSKSGRTIIDRTRLSGISNIYASPVGAAGRVYVTGRNGTTLVMERSDELTILAKNTLDERFDASAAVAGDQLFLRGAKFLYCIASSK